MRTMDQFPRAGGDRARALLRRRVSRRFGLRRAGLLATAALLLAGSACGDGDDDDDDEEDDDD